MNNDIQQMTQELAEMLGVPTYELGFQTGTQLRLGSSGLRLILDALQAQRLETGYTSDGAYRIGTAFVTWD